LALLERVEKARSGVVAGVLNSARQTGSVLGVALFGSLINQRDAFLLGAGAALSISVVRVLLVARKPTIIYPDDAGLRKPASQLVSGLQEG
jgi:hypothetical protein